MTPVTCPNCLHRNVFTSREALEHHLLVGHYRCFAYACEECRGLERFATKAKLEKHLHEDHGKAEYKIHFTPSDEDRFKIEQAARALRASLEPVPKGRDGSGNVLALTYRQPAAGGTLVNIKSSPSHNAGRPITNTGGLVRGTSKRAFAEEKPPKARKQAIKPTAKKTVGTAGGGLTFGLMRAATSQHLPLKRASSLVRKQVAPRQCVDCKTMVCGVKTSLLHHINTKHLHLSLRTCTLCEQPFDSYPLIAIYAHLAHRHKMGSQPGKNDYIETDREAMSQVEGEMQTYFPSS